MSNEESNTEASIVGVPVLELSTCPTCGYVAARVTPFWRLDNLWLAIALAAAYRMDIENAYIRLGLR